MTVCILCGSESFDEFDGNFFCESCGTQSQEIRNEVDVEEDLTTTKYGMSQNIRNLTKKKKTRRKLSQYQRRDFGKPWLSFEALQCLLKAQINALIKLGVNPAIKEIAREIWFKYLQMKEVAFTGGKSGDSIPFCKMMLRRDRQPGTAACPIPGKDEKYKMKDNKSDDDEMMDDLEEDDEQVDDFLGLESGMNKKSPSFLSDSSDSEGELSPVEVQQEHIGSLKCDPTNKCSKIRLQCKPLTVIITYIALLFANEPVTLADLIRLIGQGHVPFYKMSDVLPGHMKLSKGDINCFLNAELRLSIIRDCLPYMIIILDLPPLPPPDLNLIIAKLVLDLQLPAAVNRLALTLVTEAGYQPRTVFNRKRQLTCNEWYEEMAMSFIIVAVKLIYGLDGVRERKGIISQLLLDVPAETIECWGCVALRLDKKRKDFIANNCIMKEDDIKYMKDCKNYSLFCSEVVFKQGVANQTCQTKRPIHYRYRACQEPAIRQCEDVIKSAVDDLECGRMKVHSNFKASSFVFRRFEDGEIDHVFCKCKYKSKNNEKPNEAKSEIGLRKKRKYEKMDVDKNCEGDRKMLKDEDSGGEQFLNENQDSETDGYLIYFDDLSGLNVHDSYKFLLTICAERILLKPSEMQEFVKFVETMLFILEK